MCIFVVPCLHIFSVEKCLVTYLVLTKATLDTNFYIYLFTNFYICLSPLENTLLHPQKVEMVESLC